ncbi:GAF domain-containing protein [Amycolatopsis sp. lyj-23]|uniref:GAF domain-containing protein n=1 Tax=Amycolatopsis sp. lyj-23 TaxID=2789283 RepID=UPI00397A3D14
MGEKLLAERDTVQRVDEVTTALEHLTDTLGQEEELGVVLQRVCQQVIHAVPDAGMASVTLSRDGAPYTATFTADAARSIDQAQYDAGEGPCLEAARSGHVQRVKVAEAARQWPEFAAAAGEITVGSYLSAPLFIGRQYQGSLKLYGTGDEGVRHARRRPGHPCRDRPSRHRRSVATRTQPPTARVHLRSKLTDGFELLNDTPNDKPARYPDG